MRRCPDPEVTHTHTRHFKSGNLHDCQAGSGHSPSPARDTINTHPSRHQLTINHILLHGSLGVIHTAPPWRCTDLQNMFILNILFNTVNVIITLYCTAIFHVFHKSVFQSSGPCRRKVQYSQENLLIYG